MDDNQRCWAAEAQRDIDELAIGEGLKADGGEGGLKHREAERLLTTALLQEKCGGGAVEGRGQGGRQRWDELAAHLGTARCGLLYVCSGKGKSKSKSKSRA